MLVDINPAESRPPTTCRRTSSSPQKDSRSSRTSSSCSPPRSAARSPSGSRRRASSATSPRTPSTTTPRTSRRCSRAGSRTLQEKLRMATVIEAKDLSTDVVQVGSVVHVKDEKTGKSVKYTIVGSAEAKPAGEQALQRVARRPRAARPQAQRDRRRAGAARARAQAQDHEDRRRPQVGSPAMSASEERRGERPGRQPGTACPS